MKNNNLYNDKELNEDADLDWYDYGFRSYDPQIGRFPQLDPLPDEYPELTNYQYASCEPIANVDRDGLEKQVVTVPGKVAVVVLVAAPESVQMTVVRAGKVVAMKVVEKVAENPGVWSKIGTGLLGGLSRALGTIGWVLTPLDAGQRHDPNAKPPYPGWIWGGGMWINPNAKIVNNPVSLPVNAPKNDDDDDNNKYLVRFGAEPESAEKLEAEAAQAEKVPKFGHGVSTTLKNRISGSDKKHRVALFSDVRKFYKIKHTPTIKNPNHFTVILPKSFTKTDAYMFNLLFKVL